MAVGTTQANYPYPITDLPDVVYNFALSTGKDIVFCASDGVTKLKRDIVAYDKAAKTCEIYVEIPSLSGSADTVLYIYFHNPDADEANDAVDHSITRRIRVAANADDCRCWWDSGTSVWNQDDNVRLQAGYVSATYFKWGAGMRWLAVNICKDAQINSAKITFVARTNLANNNVNTYFTGELTGTPSDFSAGLADYQNRRGTIVGGANDDYITAAQVAWDAIAAQVTEDVVVSPELKTIVQEQVNTNAMTNLAMFWDDHDDRSTHVDNTYRQWRAYNADPADAALLVLDFTPVLTNYQTIELQYIGLGGNW